MKFVALDISAATAHNRKRLRSGRVCIAIAAIAAIVIIAIRNLP